MKKAAIIILAAIAVSLMLYFIGVQTNKEHQHCEDINGNWHYNVILKHYTCN